MTDNMNAAAVTYRAIYDSVFPSAATLTSTTERPDRETKSFALTRAAFDANRDKLVRTIACIANSAKSIGYILCRGGPNEDPLVDAAPVDDAVRSKVFPHVPFEITRQQIDGNIVDFITIETRNRPHFMMNSASELVVPFRGAANNITAGRHELDRIYEERQVLALRRLLARGGAPDEDPVEMFIAEVDWGGLSETQDQEFVFAVVPQDLGQTPLAEFICAKDAHAIVNNIWIQAMNVTGDSDWFARNAGIVTGYRDNYLEIYQPSAFQDHRIGTIRVYDMGALISRIWILEPLMDGRKRYSFNHFQTALRGTLEFTWRLYAHAGYPVGEVEIRSALVNAEDLDLWITPSVNHILPNRDVGRRLYVPKRPVVVDPHAIEAQASDLTGRIGRALRSHYGG